MIAKLKVLIRELGVVANTCDPTQGQRDTFLCVCLGFRGQPRKLVRHHLNKIKQIAFELDDGFGITATPFGQLTFQWKLFNGRTDTLPTLTVHSDVRTRDYHTAHRDSMRGNADDSK